jgi:hypothetical protein
MRVLGGSLPHRAAMRYLLPLCRPECCSWQPQEVHYSEVISKPLQIAYFLKIPCLPEPLSLDIELAF